MRYLAISLLGLLAGCQHNKPVRYAVPERPVFVGTPTPMVERTVPTYEVPPSVYVQPPVYYYTPEPYYYPSYYPYLRHPVYYPDRPYRGNRNWDHRAPVGCGSQTSTTRLQKSSASGCSWQKFLICSGVALSASDRSVPTIMFLANGRVETNIERSDSDQSISWHWRNQRWPHYG